jgi:hypothetical protein
MSTPHDLLAPETILHMDMLGRSAIFSMADAKKDEFVDLQALKRRGISLIHNFAQAPSTTVKKP